MVFLNSMKRKYEKKKKICIVCSIFLYNFYHFFSNEQANVNDDKDRDTENNDSTIIFENQVTDVSLPIYCLCINKYLVLQNAENFRFLVNHMENTIEKDIRTLTHYSLLFSKI